MKDIIRRLRSMGSNEWLESGDDIVTVCRDGAAEIERLRASQERLKSAIEFAHSEGFQWPSDPMQEFADKNGDQS